MSEIKGQLLSIILVLSVFAVVGGALYASYKKAATDVGTKIEQSPTTQFTPAAVNALDANLLTY